jgi:arylformamidase
MAKQTIRLLAAAAALLLMGPAAAADAAYTAHPDLSYDQGSPVVPAAQNKLDLYSPVGFAGPRPVVVYVHGGSWRVGDKANQIARKRDLFTGAGYVFASVNYRLSPDPPDTSDPGRVMFPDHPDDVGEAVGWLADNVGDYGGDPQRIILIGHSAGAHLASLLGAFPASPAPGYLQRYGVGREQILGVISLDTDAFDVADRISELGPGGQLNFHSAFGTPAENAGTGGWALASPLTWAGAADPPFLIVTQAAAPDRIADSRTMQAALGQSPGDGLLTVPLDHEGINDALGDPADATAETATVVSFAASLVAASSPAGPKLGKRPPKLVRTSKRKARVKLSFKGRGSAAAECRLDGGAFRRCRSPRRYRLRPGRHTIRIRAQGLVMGKEVGAPGKAFKVSFRVARR